jgi:hypothetical protein
VSTLSVRHGWTIRQDDQRACTCTPANPRHTQGWHCIPQREIDTWRATSLAGPRNARILYWLEREYGSLKSPRP